VCGFFHVKTLVLAFCLGFSSSRFIIPSTLLEIQVVLALAAESVFIGDNWAISAPSNNN
jgi:hypothetical protein